MKTDREKMRLAKKQVFDYLNRMGILTKGRKHKHLMWKYFERMEIARPQSDLYAVLVLLSERGLIGDKSRAAEQKAIIQQNIERRIQISRENGKESHDAKKQEYNDYLNSSKWKAFRLEVFKHYGERCILCDSTSRIHVHHKHYRTFMNETLTDVIPLCERCHKKHHR